MAKAGGRRCDRTGAGACTGLPIRQPGLQHLHAGLRVELPLPRVESGKYLNISK